MDFVPVKRWCVAIIITLFSSLSFGADNLEVKLSIYCYRISTVRGAEVLIFKPKNNNNNTWECCSGNLLPNESFKSAGKRIIKSAADINTTHWIVRDYSYYKDNNDKTIPILFMTCKAYSEDLVNLNTSIYSDYMWANLNDIGQINLEEHLKQELTKLLIIYDQSLKTDYIII